MRVHLLQTGVSAHQVTPWVCRKISKVKKMGGLHFPLKLKVLSMHMQEIDLPCVPGKGLGNYCGDKVLDPPASGWGKLPSGEGERKCLSHLKKALSMHVQTTHLPLELGGGLLQGTTLGSATMVEYTRTGFLPNGGRCPEWLLTWPWQQQIPGQTPSQATNAEHFGSYSRPSSCSKAI